MKYIILSKDMKKGKPGDDIDTTSGIKEYFELGWESIGSRFDFIASYNQGLIDENNTTVVTIEDRMFMYSKFFKNVISYDEFKNIDVKEIDIIIDYPESFPQVTAYYPELFSDKNDKNKYFRKKEDQDLIFNGFDIDDAIKPESSFVVMCIRHRDWCKDRNSDLSFWQKLVNGINGAHDIFVVGKNNENFCFENNITYIPKLRDYVSLIKNKNCKGVILQSTGTAVLALTCSESDIYFVDHAKVSSLHNNASPICGSRQIHFFTGGLFPYYDLSDKTVTSILKGVL